MKLVAGASPMDHGNHFSSSLDELRAEVLQSAGFVFVLLGLGINLVLAYVSELPRETLLITITLCGTGLLSLQVSRAGVQLSAITLVTGLASALCIAIYLFPTAPIVCFLSIVVPFAGILIGLVGAATTAIVMTSLIVGFAHSPAHAVLDEVAIVAVLLTWANVFVTWLLIRPLQTALNWSWFSLVQAQEIAEEARRRQGELVGLTKSLNETLDRVEQITAELERARRAAEDARKLKSAFAAAVSHELRTPLNLIIGFSEIIVQSPCSIYNEPLPACYADDVDVIYRNAQQISTLIDDILDLSRIDAQRMGLQRKHVSLRDIVEEASSGLAARFAAHGLTLTIEVPENLPPVYVDPTRIRQVLVNLLVNAMRFTHRGGMHVSVQLRERDILVSVSDTGAGIAPEDLPYVFEGFRQAASGESARGGSGLGLTVSKRFVEMHGGSIQVSSKPGEGTCVRIALPKI